MVAKTFVNDAGTWRTVKAIYVNDGTAWRTVRNQWVKDSAGTWRLVHQGAFIYSETVSTPTANYNLRTKLTAAGWNGTDDVDASITINPGVTVYSTAIPTAGFILSPALPAGSTVTLTNAGTITGKGGAGGAGGDATVAGTAPYPVTVNNGTNGSAGGLGMLIASPITINNTGGIIGGGGGGGGGGGSRATYNGSGPGPTKNAVAGGSAGSGGASSAGSPALGGPGGTVTIPAPVSGVFAVGNGTSGNAGTATAGAAVPGVTVLANIPAGLPTATAVGGAGGAGGARGSAGSAGGLGSSTGSPAVFIPTSAPAATSGGAGGTAISGNPFVTLPVPQLGTISGPRV